MFQNLKYPIRQAQGKPRSQPVILNRSAAEVKNLAPDRWFGYCGVRFFASLRFAQNDTGMIIFLEQPKHPNGSAYA